MFRAAAVALVVTAAIVGCTPESITGSPSEANAKFCRDGAIALDVGQVAMPSGGGKRCRFKAVAGAEYALAWYDTRALTASQTQVEPAFDSYALFITIEPDNVALREAASRSRAALRETAVPVPAASADHGSLKWLTPSSEGVLQTRPRFRTTPFAADELFLLEDEFTGLPRHARIVRLYGSDVAVARWEDEAPDDLPPFLTQLDTSMAMISLSAMPALRETFLDEWPRSTSGGQMLILLRQDLGVVSHTWAEVANDSLFTWMELVPIRWTSPVRLAQAIAHQLGHHYEIMWMHASRPMPGMATTEGATFWAVEGVANLMSYEFVRRAAGIAPNGNHDWRAAPTDTATKIFQSRAQPAAGVLTDGYDSAMGFLRDLIARRVRSGEPHGDALRAVARGALEGWYGHDEITTRTGLVARMQGRFGTGWTASNAVLDWALSYPGDDLTANTQYQDLSSLRIWDLPPGQTYGWRADAFLSESQPTEFLFKRAGSPGFARLFDNGNGVHVEIEGYQTPIVWKVLRIR